MVIFAQNPRSRRTGFTLVEVMIVIALIGLLSVIATPSLIKARQQTTGTAMANSFRIFDGAFEQFRMDTGTWPAADWARGAYPVGMQNWLPAAWLAESPVGGFYAFAPPAADDHPQPARHPHAHHAARRQCTRRRQSPDGQGPRRQR